MCPSVRARGPNATKTTSAQTRLTAWNDNFYAIGHNPLGVGIGSARSVAKLNFLQGGTREAPVLG